MFARRLTVVSSLQRIATCEAVRYIRRNVKIPINLTERKSKRASYSSEYLADVEKSNVGIGRVLRSHLEGFGKDVDEFSDDEDLDMDKCVDDVYPNLLNLRSELEEKETQKSFQNIKRKYFRPEKLPGMLTYIEKQQILHLHKENPDDWNVYKLAEGFPATPEIIKKVLKSNFVAYTVQQVLRHDERVRKNWEAFERGELTFDEELQKIYASFTGRSRFVTDVKEIEKYIPPPPDFSSHITTKEFSSIIASSHKYQLEAERQRKNVEIDEQGRSVYKALPGSGAYAIEEDDLSTSRWAKHHTLGSLRNEINRRSKVREVDKIIASCEPPKELEEPYRENEERLLNEIARQYDHGTSTTGVISKDFDPLMLDKITYNYPLRIDIPRKLWKKDKKYRCGDCFYDDNGYFLYRVPGLKF